MIHRTNSVAPGNRFPGSDDLFFVERDEGHTSGDDASIETVGCDDARILVSVVADDEATRHERRTLDAHLDGCADCSSFAAALTGAERRLRMRPAEPVPDLVLAVTSRVRPAVLGRGGWMRPALAWVAIVLFAQNIVPLVLGRTDGAETHLARHLGAFGVAMAIGFAYVAWRPHRSFGMLPFAGALVLTMFASAGFDLIDGDRSPLAESAHLAELAGLALLWMIAGSPGWNGWGDIRDRVGDRLHPVR
ncbi:MAG: zf-HC2 domain-containing protein [Ilumatobacter sp.]|uniref:zf-HC2 domain-containing protein n=2 Tax=Ilumatobacter sp. TaxID=1967498 RepID=UPI0032967E5D